MTGDINAYPWLSVRYRPVLVPISSSVVPVPVMYADDSGNVYVDNSGNAYVNGIGEAQTTAVILYRYI